MKFIIRLLINAIALAVISYLSVGGVHATGIWPSLIVGAIVLGIANAILKPILIVVSCPLEVLTLGLFTLVINALIFYFGLKLVPGWVIPSFMSAFWAALVMSIISWILSMVLGENREDRAQPRGGSNS
jgi:putative membrane protein